MDDFVALTSPFNTVDDLDGTLCVWFNTLQQSAGWIIGQDFSGSNRDWWFTSNRNNAGRLVFMIDDTADNNREVESDPGNDLSDGQWHQVCGLWGDTGMSMYIDGTLQSNTNAYDIYPNTAVASYIGCYRGGTYPSGTSCNGNFDGKVDDIHIYSRALNKIEISKLYCDGGWCEHQSLVAYYPFNGNANDESGNGNDGDINEETDSEPTLTTDRFGNENSAYSFDGINDFIVIDPEFSYSNEISMGGWLKIDALSKGITIVSKRFGNFGGEDFQLYYEGPGDYKMVGILWGLSTERCRGTINSVIDNDWHHYFFTYDGSFMVMYIDGVINQTCTSSGTVNNNNLNMRIGEDWYGNYGDGDIDEVRIYNRALSASEVQALYQQ